jgi:hypothetical protein
MYIYAYKLAVEDVEIGGVMTTLLSKEPFTHYETRKKTSTKNL